MLNEDQWERLSGNKHKIIATAKHESGHWVIGRKLGFGVGGIILNARINHLNGCIWIEGISSALPYRPIGTIQETKEYLEARIIALYSGALAESLIDAQVCLDRAKTLWDETAWSDSAKAEELLIALKNIAYPSDATNDEILNNTSLLRTDLQSRASGLVEEHGDEIRGLSRKIWMHFLDTKNDHLELKVEQIEAWLEELI